MLKRLFNKKTFDHIFRENYTYLYKYAFHITGDEEESRDIVSGVFESLWKNIERFDKEKAKPYLKVSVRNRCVDFLRKNTLHNKYMDEYLNTLSRYYDELADQREQDELVETMLSQLPENTRHILDLCYFQRLKYSEVAEQLDISPDTVKKHIVKALKLLRTIYNEKK
ncbi:RNA polymerase sigma factor [Sphingobacterium yanglingense]|uniref:RNA polymerase sigma-70 factor (ECF subfamily) n=1 Tax=Sphingobacterium yanglingense TaxID=1437280 RepID=A0A4R6WMQ4_9SPHI|nr:RNA polymerase sigma-70 factor [Sphingobacterium yanglingense]TDQ80118.1 RNA polymerase sigma-70 factor (ECF subfamily) [Sphingobacterium yanglingense]